MKENQEVLKDKKKELEDIRSYKLIGNMTRVRAEWVEECLKQINYFFYIENLHFTKRIFPKLIKTENEERERRDQIEIQTEVELFYKTLCSKNTCTNNANNDNYDYVEPLAGPNVI